MNIFFDVDDTLVTWDFRLRPHVQDVFKQLQTDGHKIYVWSGRGKRWDVVLRYELSEYIVTCHEKPLEDHHEKLAELGVDVWPDFVIDDFYSVVHAFGGYYIATPRNPLESDRELLHAYEAVQQFLQHQAAGNTTRFIARWDQRKGI